MLNEKLVNNMQRVIIVTLFDSLYKVNKISKKEYKKLLEGVKLMLA